MAGRRAVFLDRDGTIIYDAGYIRDPHQVRLLPGAGEALARLQEHGFLLVLVSNQSGIGRGFITLEEAEEVHRQVVSSLAHYGARLDATYYCPHRPEDGCPCRKPSPEMLFWAARDLDLDLSQCHMVGDKPSDIDAGKRANCRTILLTADLKIDWPDPEPDDLAANWLEAERCILSSTGVTA